MIEHGFHPDFPPGTDTELAAIQAQPALSAADGLTDLRNLLWSCLLYTSPVSDPSMKALTVAQIEATVKNGKGKMKPVAGLTDPQVSAVAAYFKSLK